MRRLAYKIQKAENAHYILMNFEIEAKFLNEFKGLLDADERVIRNLVMKRDEAITEDCPPPPEFHSVRSGDEFDDEDEEEEFDEDEEGDGDEDGDNVEYEVDDDGNVVMVLYEDDEEEEQEEGEANEPEQGEDQSNNARRENRRTANVGG